MKQVYRPKATDVSLSNTFKTLEKDLLSPNKSVNDNVDGVVGGPSIATSYCDLERGQERDSAQERSKKDFRIKKGNKKVFKIKKMFENVFKIM